jgi:hypothetical protein
LAVVALHASQTTYLVDFEALLMLAFFFGGAFFFETAGAPTNVQVFFGILLCNW